MRPVLHASTLAVQATLSGDLGAEPLSSVVRLDAYLATGGYALLRELLAHPECYEIVSFDTIDVAPRGYLRQLGQEWALN